MSDTPHFGFVDSRLSYRVEKLAELNGVTTDTIMELRDQGLKIKRVCRGVWWVSGLNWNLFIERDEEWDESDDDE